MRRNLKIRFWIAVFLTISLTISLCISADITSTDQLVWTLKTGRPGAQVIAAGAVDGYVYVLSATDRVNNPTPGICQVDIAFEQYNPTNDTWNVLNPLPTPRVECNMVATPDGRIVVLGGRTADCDPFQVYDTVEEFDPTLNTWRGRQPMPRHRYGMGSAITQSGKVYVFAGTGYSGAFTVPFVDWVEVDEYDLEADSWATVAFMGAPGSAISVASLNNSVYINKYSANGTNTYEELNTASMEWRSLSALNLRDKVLCPGPNNKILALGGRFPDALSVHEFDPRSDMWRSRDNLRGIVPIRAGPTLAKNGRVYAMHPSLQEGVIVPPVSVSYYMSPTNLYERSFELGKQKGQTDRESFGAQSSVVILNYRRPVIRMQPNVVYGASLGLEGSFYSVERIERSVVNYAAGYYCSSDDVSHLLIVIGTSNDGQHVTYRHGQAWGELVNNVSQWLVANGLSGQVDVAGGIDAELDYNNFVATKNWVDGFNSVVVEHYLYNFGDAGGCPQDDHTGLAECNNHWTQDQVWYISWGAVNSRPLPQIYNIWGSNAKQWAQLCLYSYEKHPGFPMVFDGLLTTAEACLQRGPCRGIDNPPEEGWEQLDEELNSEFRSMQYVKWLTDIKWVTDIRH